VLQEQQRRQGLSPSLDSRKDDDHGDRGLRERQHDEEENLEFVHAVDPGLLGDLVGQAEEELPHEEYEKRIAEESGHDDRQKGVDPVQLGEDVEEGDDQDRERKEDRGQHDAEQKVAARPLNAGETVGDQRI